MQTWLLLGFLFCWEIYCKPLNVSLANVSLIDNVTDWPIMCFLFSPLTDTKNSAGIVGCIEEVAHNAIAVYWNPLESSAKVSICPDINVHETGSAVVVHRCCRLRLSLSVRPRVMECNLVSPPRGVIRNCKRIRNWFSCGGGWFVSPCQAGQLHGYQDPMELHTTVGN